MKVVLIYPRFKTRMATGLEEPLGLLYLAAILRAQGHRVGLHNFSFATDLNAGAMTADLHDTDLIGFSASSALFGKAVELLRHLKTVAPDIPTLIGGSHATTAPEEALDKGFDYVALGESENTLPEFMDLLARGRAHECSGIACKIAGKVHLNPRRDFIQNLDSLPFPARDLLDYSRYPTIGMIASRGCPFHCLFCKPMIDQLFGTTVRFRSAANVAAEIEQAIGVLGNKEIAFKDDTLTILPISWFEELHQELSRRKLNVRWQANSRVDTVTGEKLALMRKSGCSQIGFGVESGSPRVLEFYRKQTRIDQVEQAFRWCHELGILPHAFLMLGAPEETLDDLRMTYDLVRRIKPASWIICTTTAFPGNHLFSYARENDLLNISGYDDYDSAENSVMNRSPLRLKYLKPSDIRRYRDKINFYLLLVNAVNPRVLFKAFRRPGAVLHGLRNILSPS